MDKEKDKEKDKSDKIEMKALMESAAVADYLTALAKGFQSGRIVVEKDGESLTLTPAETAEVEVEARVKKDKARFSLEVTWRLAQAQDEPASLKISAGHGTGEAAGKAETCCKKEEKKEEKKPEAAKVAEVKKPDTQKPDAQKPNTPKGEAPKPAAPAAPAQAQASAPAPAQGKAAEGKPAEGKPATLPAKS